VTDLQHIVVDGHPVAFQPGDSIAIAMLRAGETPGGGGTLCLAGDCGNCLVEADGVAYIRSCQTASRPGLTVQRHPADGEPLLPIVADPDLTAPPPGREVSVRRVETEAVIIGGGAGGIFARSEFERAGRNFLLLDAAAGDEAVAVYAGPMVGRRRS
jgi:hypothetical protein